MNDMFLGTQIEKLNKLFHGVMDYSAYGKSMRYKLKEGAIVKDEDIEKIYRLIEDINDKYERLELPAVVFYTNIKPTKCPICNGEKMKEVMLHKGCGGEVIEEEESKKFRCKKCKKGNIEAEDVMEAIECENCKYRGEEGKEEEGKMFSYVFG